MEKNITPNNVKKPDFLRTFLLTLSVFLLLNLIFGKKPEPIKPVTFNKEANNSNIKRVLHKFKTDTVSGNFNSNGIRIDDFILNKYKQNKSNTSPNIEMLNYSKNSKDNKYIEVGFLSSDDKNIFPDRLTNWKVINKTNNSIKLSWINKNNIKFLRTILLDDKYMLRVNDEVINNSNNKIEFYPYIRMVNNFDILKQVFASHHGFVGFLGNNLYEYAYKSMDTRINEINAKTGWFGFTTDYFMNIFIPQNNEKPFTVRTFALDNDKTAKDGKLIKQFQSDYISEAVTIDKEKRFVNSSLFYIGPKQQEIIKEYENKYKIEKFDLSIDYGYFYILTKPFTKILKYLYEFTGNFGLAIIIFTILVRLLFFPIVQKSFKNMAIMKKLQPEVTRIQQLYSGNKQMASIEIMMLYRKNKVNPLSGCLPILLQIPVFFSLYKALIISIEMRHAPFILWINDLSSADTTNIFNLFGLLPFTPYKWLPVIGILPIIMGITIYLQQKIQPIVANMDNVQLRILKFFPLFLVFIFAKFPAGLLIYWIVNNILSILQQRLIK